MNRLTRKDQNYETQSSLSGEVFMKYQAYNSVMYIFHDMHRKWIIFLMIFLKLIQALI